MPESIQTKARDLLAAFLAGDIHARKQRRFSTHYLALNVGPRYRLLCLRPERCKEPTQWQLLTHERYNSAVSKRP